MESKKEPVFNSKLFSNLKDTYKVNDGYKLNDPGFENKSEEESSEKDDSDFEEEFMKYNNYLNNDNFDYMKIENNYTNNNTKTNKKKKKKKIKKLKSYNIRKGDWLCPKCNNINFSFRIKCNICGINKEIK